MLIPKNLLRAPENENTQGGGGEPVFGHAEIKTGGMPESLKGQEFSIDEPEEKLAEEIASDLNDGEPNKLPPTEEKLEPGEIKGDERIKNKSNKVVEKEPVVEKKEPAKSGLNVPQDEKLEENLKQEEKPVVGTDNKIRESAKQKLEGRDYSIFPKESHELLKKTSNEAFEFVKKAYADLQKEKETREGLEAKFQDLEKTGFPTQWTNHPQAYQLHPEYQKLVQDSSYVTFEQEFYKRQLSAIKQGEKYIELRGYDKQGKPVYSEPLDAGPDAEVEMLTKYNEASSQLRSINNQAQNIQHGFKAKYDQATGYVNKIIAEQWPWFGKDEKHPSIPHLQAFLKASPMEFRDHPATMVAGLLYASLQAEIAKRVALEAKMNKQEVIVKESAKAEETVSSPVSQSVGGVNITRFGARKKDTYQPPATFSIDD